MNFAFKQFISEIKLRFTPLEFYFKTDSKKINLCFVKDKNIAFIWLNLHSSKQIQPTDLDNKRLELSTLGYSSIIIWEDQYLLKKDILFSRIGSLIGRNTTIFARKTLLKKMNKLESVQFFNDNHLMGWANARYKFGLFFENTCCAAISFSNPKSFIINNEVIKSYELVRFANKMNFTVTGGLSKLIKNFISTIHPDEIMTYVDKDWSDGKSFKKLGFKNIGELKAITFYIDEETKSRISVNQSKIKTNEELRNLDQVFNTGSIKLKWYKP